ncbi:MAG: malto-oligosyltrehalose trehalohydrolase [Acidobacteria bacterium]|nr:malto-oligosyltrehalose trehalohydrolase [Acidobacteriota bacterium]
MPFGAAYRAGEGVRFRLWAPRAKGVALHLSDQKGQVILDMHACGEGWFELISERAGPGSHYQYQIDGGIKIPDPASRFQPTDVHGPSEVIDPEEVDWDDSEWFGREWGEAVIYELHIGTFTPQGSFAGVLGRLDYLADLGVTCIELMPISDFPGARNWGYDGVLPFAPESQYGRPGDLKRLVQAAHARGLMVFLDVVYNHFGPEGNYLGSYAPEFFTDRHRTPWGDAINFYGPGSRVVRDFFIHNALYWLREYHFDGLRLDAVDRIRDLSHPDILTEIASTVRNTMPGHQVHLVLENDDNAAHYLGPSRRLFDAQWNDDMHHALHVTLTNECDGYYADYAREPVRRAGRCLTQGFDYQGQVSDFREGICRGEPSQDLPPTCFVSFLQNHDQIGNRAFGERILKLADPRAVKTVMTILLLAPQPPLLFMGEEFGADTPFLFFCDFGGQLAEAVTQGRRNEFSRFARFSDPQLRAQIPDPSAPETFLRSQLDWHSAEQSEHARWLQFYRDTLHIRQQEIIPRLRGVTENRALFSMLGERALIASWELDGARLSLLANLGEGAVEHASRVQGKLLYGTPDREADFWSKLVPAWSAAWFLQNNGDRF